MFFPALPIAVMLSIAAGTRLCCNFFRQCRSQAKRKIEGWSLVAASIVMGIDFCIADERLTRALIYFSTLMTTRFVISLIVYCENDRASDIKRLKQLNDEMQRTFEQLKSEPPERLQEIEFHYSNQIKCLREQLRKTNCAQRRLLRNIEARREDIQQLIFDMLETTSDGCHVFRQFEDALIGTKTKLEIFSPNMSFKVVRSLMPEFKRLLEANVVITIHYRAGNDFCGKLTQKTAKMLRKEFKDRDKFRLYPDNEGIKKFIGDENLPVLSDFSILSNSMRNS